MTTATGPAVRSGPGLARFGPALPAFTLATALTLVSASVIPAPWEARSAGAAAPKSDPKADPKSSDEKIPEVEMAGDLFRRGQVDKARELLVAVAAKRPDLPLPDVMLARLMLAAGKAQPARQLLESAAGTHPDNPDVYATFGNLALAEGRFSDAWLCYRKVRELVEADTRLPAAKRTDLLTAAFSGSAMVAESRRQWRQAETEIAEALTFNKSLIAAGRNDAKSERVRLLQRHARALFHLGRERDALADLKAAIVEDDKIEPAESTLATLYASRARDTEARREQDPLLVADVPAPEADDAKAEDWHRRAITLHPKEGRSRIAFAAFLLDRGRVEDAVKEVDEALKLLPDSSDALRIDGLLARRMRKHDRAEAAFERLYARSPSDAAAVNQLALTLADQDVDHKKTRALELAQVNARSFPKDAEALSTLGYVCWRTGRLDDAERFLRDAVQAAGGRVSPDGLYFLAAVLGGREGRLDETLKVLKSALESKGVFVYRKDAEALMAKLRPAGTADPKPEPKSDPKAAPKKAG